MANRRRGEVEVTFDGQTYCMCLTLGALAELEASFGDEDMMALASRFEDGRLKSEDAIRIIGAGLRGGGYDLDDERVALMRCDNGAAGYVAAVADLLQVTFAGAGDAVSDNTTAPASTSDVAPAEEGRAAPFPGARSQHLRSRS